MGTPNPYPLSPVLILSGPTATGKTSLALQLAREFDGELISADSRQVYQGMDIVTGKDKGNSKFEIRNLISNFQFPISPPVQMGYYPTDGIPVWGLDFVQPDQSFDVTTYTTVTHQIIKDIHDRNKLPIVVGGTGFYIRSLLYPQATFGMPMNPKLRQQLELQSIKELQRMLNKVDVDKFNKMNSSDRNNPRRLIRAIEVARHIKTQEHKNIRTRDENDQVSTEEKSENGKWKVEMSLAEGAISNFQFPISSQLSAPTSYQLPATNCSHLHLTLTASIITLEQRIKARVLARIQAGAEQEVRDLISQGYDWHLPAMSALGYRDWRDYLDKKITLNQLVETWTLHEVQYAKRQLTWFKKEKTARWLDIEAQNCLEKAMSIVREWKSIHEYTN